MQFEIFKQPQVDGGHVPHVAHPIWALRLIEAGMGGHVYGEALRHLLIEGQPPWVAHIAVQDQQRFARPSCKEVHLSPGDLNEAFGASLRHAFLSFCSLIWSPVWPFGGISRSRKRVKESSAAKERPYFAGTISSS